MSSSFAGCRGNQGTSKSGQRQRSSTGGLLWMSGRPSPVLGGGTGPRSFVVIFISRPLSQRCHSNPLPLQEQHDYDWYTQYTGRGVRYTEAGQGPLHHTPPSSSSRCSTWSSLSGIWRMCTHKLMHIQQTAIVYYWTA